MITIERPNNKGGQNRAIVKLQAVVTQAPSTAALSDEKTGRMFRPAPTVKSPDVVPEGARSDSALDLV